MTRTSIQQSKQLKEILPIETADCCYKVIKYKRDGETSYEYFSSSLPSENTDDIPAWSLEALFDVLSEYEYKLFKTSTGYDIKVYCNGDKEKLCDKDLFQLLINTIIKIKS